MTKASVRTATAAWMRRVVALATLCGAAGASTPQAATTLPPGEEVVVASFANHRVQFFARDADGNAVPTRSIAGPSTQLNQPNGVAFGPDEIFVANHEGRSVLVFPRDAGGDAAPSRVIAGPLTGLGRATHIRVYGDELFVATYDGAPLAVFDLEVDGNVAPKRVLATIGSVYGIAIDGEQMFLSRHPDSGDHAIYVFARTASGNDAPIRVIQGQSLNFPAGLALTPTELIVADYFNNVVRVFDRNAEGPTAALRVFADASGLLNPIDLFHRDGEIFVAARASHSIRVYPADASGAAVPSRVIAGAATQLDQPIALIDSSLPGAPDAVYADGFEAP